MSNYCHDVERLIAVEYIVRSVKVSSRIDEIPTASVVIGLMNSEDGGSVVSFPNIQFVTRLENPTRIAVSASPGSVVYSVRHVDKIKGTVIATANSRSVNCKSQFSVQKSQILIPVIFKW